MLRQAIEREFLRFVEDTVSAQVELNSLLPSALIEIGVCVSSGVECRFGVCSR